MDTDKLHSFCVVVESGSFSKAAEKLYCSQPAVTKKIMSLENELGFQLFDRNGKKYQINQNGQLVYEFGKQIESDLYQLKKKLKEMNTDVKKIVRFGVTNYIGVYIVPVLLDVFKQKYYHIPTNFIVDFSPNIIDLLVQEKINFAFLPESKSLLSNHQLQCKFFCKDEMLLVFPNNHEISKIGVIDTATLAQYPFLLSQEQSATREFIVTKLREKGVSLDNVVNLYSTEAIKQSIIAGIGISILSEHSVKNEIAYGLLKAQRLTDLTLSRDLYVVALKDKLLQECDLQFIEEAEKCVAV